MKKWLLILLLGLFLSGCGAAARESEFWQHDTLYKDWGHMWFSLYGYKNPTEQKLKESREKGWWGIDIPYIPAQ